jgi:hypothetical protein
MKEEKLFHYLVKLTNNADKNRELFTGEQKKDHVLKEFLAEIGEELYERYGPFIELTIDGIIDISKKKLKIFPRKYKLCLNCISDNGID